ncbi:hypothetical protein Pint_06214 [Pistacia integerrima]|uniref:Uncharacterized protein n=1 Tax=Pistacia integerrima TaxID=434235 RepID=A0ACC0Z0I1_9ROSI|nr:hypothetical protein Pint_06214 [Pistacia integerrima]
MATPSLENLNEAYLQANQNKSELLKSHEAASVSLAPLASSQPKKKTCYMKYQVLELLKTSLQSTGGLTSVFLRNKGAEDVAVTDSNGIV